MSASTAGNVFLEFSAGDAAQHALLTAASDAAQSFIDSGEAAALGFAHIASGTPLSELAPDDRESLAALYAATKGGQDGAGEGGIKVNFDAAPVPLALGRVEFALLDDESPKCAENFRALCSGEKGECRSARGKKLHYKDCPVFRVEKGFCVQSGDVTRGDGSGGESIWNKKFQDDRGGLKLKHGERGLLSMANGGRKNTNTSQFFVVLARDGGPKLDGKHCVFGRTVSGIEVLDELEERHGSDSGSVVDGPVWISDCGVLT
jgi:cyclophilin family peptidyl-prolyl cis-trans isomerase